MTKKEPTRQPKTHIMTVRLTAAEFAQLSAYAAENCVNISALVRRLLFNEIRKTSPRERVGA